MKKVSVAQRTAEKAARQEVNDEKMVRVEATIDSVGRLFANKKESDLARKFKCLCNITIDGLGHLDDKAAFYSDDEDIELPKVGEKWICLVKRYYSEKNKCIDYDVQIYKKVRKQADLSSLYKHE